MAAATVAALLMVPTPTPTPPAPTPPPPPPLPPCMEVRLEEAVAAEGEEEDAGEPGRVSFTWKGPCLISVPSTHFLRPVLPDGIVESITVILS